MEAGDRYKHLIITHYEHWTLYLNEEKQLPYVGRCYAWWKDRRPHQGEGMNLSNVPFDAYQELFYTIFPDVLVGCTRLGYPSLGSRDGVANYGHNFLLNTCYLANEEVHNHHMHWHFIPRFRQPLEIPEIGITSIDTRWGKNYLQPPDAPRLSPEQLEYIRKMMEQ